MGFGALFADAVESFFKRRAGIGPGKTWVPFDQIDYIIGGLVFVAPFVSLSFADIARIFVLYFGLHFLFSFLAYKIGWKKSPI
jgi:CDP-2,3-bis-(O-geranylgeranyl)-sn-glycerol synthase